MDENKKYAFNDVPFNFVPLNEKVFIPEWGNLISQDKPFEDGEDGIIDFTITNLTPLFVKNGVGDNPEDGYSAHVTDNEGKKHYFIPSTSIKGMLRSVVEIMSFSKMQPYDDDTFGERNFGGNKVKGGTLFVKNMSEDYVRCGWLRKEVGKNGEDEYYIYGCSEIEKKDIASLPSYYEKLYKKNLVEKINFFKKKTGGSYPTIEGKSLVCTGYINNKAHEYLFPRFSENLNRQLVSQGVMETFLSVYKPSRDYYPFIKDTLNQGKELAVFFIKNNNDEVAYLGITRMFRYPFKHKISDGVRQKCGEGRDLAECIFGYTGKNDSLRGRVRFDNAFTSNVISDKQLVKIQGVLGQPLASYYPYYLQQDDKTYVTYNNDKITIAGRKRYRIHADDNLSEMPKGNENENTMSVLKLLPQGNRFRCSIRVHNLRPQETGAILSALTFHGFEYCHHSIGMGKSFGYGKIKVDDVKLRFFQHEDAVHYMRAFEKLMNKAVSGWAMSKQMLQLMVIAYDHYQTLGYMELDQYGETKKVFSRLTESPTGVNAYKRYLVKPKETRLKEAINNLVVDNGWKKNYKSLTIEQLEAYKADVEKVMAEYEATFNKVAEIFNKLEEELKQEEMDKESWMDEYKQKINDKKVTLDDMKAETDAIETLIAHNKRMAGGLESLLESVNSFGNLIGTTKKWLKENDRPQTPEQTEVEAITGTLTRIYGALKPKEQKKWDKDWKRMKEIIGNQALIDEIATKIKK